MAHAPSSASTDMGGTAFALAQAAGNRRARAVLAKELHGLPWSWQQLHECPLWVVWPIASREALCALAGLGWLKLSLRSCIDGRQLAPIVGLVGPQALSAVLNTDTQIPALALASAPKPLLPPQQSIAAYVVAWGRALLVWGCPHACRDALAGHLSWADAPALVNSIDVHPEWAQTALRQAHATAAAAGLAPVLPQDHPYTTDTP